MFFTVANWIGKCKKQCFPIQLNVYADAYHNGGLQKDTSGVRSQMKGALWIHLR